MLCGIMFVNSFQYRSTREWNEDHLTAKFSTECHRAKGRES